ncbi:patatin-like phospholipase family protein [Rhodoblastus sp.]|uniref:patatin-like phospholipase family protein n=1 Tax=Rhodoblastus sp. TaxID=1962975 RepID=UPI003F9C0D91
MTKNSGDTDPAQASTAGRRTPFEQIALLLQGGGALGSYQGGVYQALAEADLHPDWVAGISIGAFNSAIIAGNPPEARVDRLREFWETVCASPFGIPFFRFIDLKNDFSHMTVNQARAWNILMFGAPKFFVPRPPPTVLFPGHAARASFYDNAPIRETLARVVDFDRINKGYMRFSVRAVDVCSGNFTYFDTTTHRIAVEHIVASGSLPPAFPSTEVDGNRPQLHADADHG